MGKPSTKEHRHLYYIKNRERILNKVKKYRKEHPEKAMNIPGYWSKHWEEVRESFFSIYGDACSCCGETNYIFLVLDHIMGPERKIKSNRKSYLDAIKNYDPEEYRTLCHNCNQATMGGRVCPHQLQKEETMENLFKIREVNYG